MNSKVWITGAGAISALGSGVDTHLKAIQDERTGLAPLELFAGKSPDPCICGVVPRDTLSVSIDASAANRADLLAANAFGEATRQAHLDECSQADLIIGTTLGNMHGGTCYYRALTTGADPDLNLIKGVLPNHTADYLLQMYALHGKSITVSNACASGTTALGTAATHIRQKRSRCVIAGGVDALSPFVVAGFNSLRLVSKTPCRPFDMRRDGLSPGEGAAVLVLEDADFARARGAKPLSAIAGYGTALEAYHYTRSHPEGKGIAAAIVKALESANMKPEQIGHIHAHGTATVFNDLSEYHGFKSVFGDRLCTIPVSSSKSMTGHTFGAAGALAAVFSLIALNNHLTAPTLFCEHTDPLFGDLHISCHAGSCAAGAVLSVALGFGGEVAAIIFESVNNV